MNIAVIGSGNIGSTLAGKWKEKGHKVLVGARNPETTKGREKLLAADIPVLNIEGAVRQSDILLLATPAMAAVEVAIALGNTTGKIILDAGNIVMGRGPQGFPNVTEAILANTATRDVVKCFNTTGFNNMLNPQYQGTPIDLFMAGDSVRGKEIARQLALDAGFAECYDVGGNSHFTLMEQFAFFWINLAMFQGQGREIGFKLLKR
jgi:predicted dinucleotide-binding enzyme